MRRHNAQAKEDGFQLLLPHAAEHVEELLAEFTSVEGAARVPRHLLDCGADVRLLAAQHTPLTDDARRWLAELRDDPIEEEQVRNAAAERTEAT